MVKGRDEMGVRGSISSSVRIVGAGAPGGIRLPCASTVQRDRTRNEAKANQHGADFFIGSS
jgi:hypothetical protein